MTRAPSPSSPTGPADGPEGYAITVRPFGTAAGDLEIDLQRRDPAIVPEIIRLCATGADGRMPDPSVIEELQLGRRTEYLLLAAGGDGERLIVPLRCTGEGCGEAIEIELDAAGLLAAQHEAYAAKFVTVETGDRTLMLRRPTGSDLARWGRAGFADEAAAIAGMIRELQVDGSGDRVPTAGEIRQIERSMQEHDPLVIVPVVVRCPACGREGQHLIDLEDLLLRRLGEAQRALIRDVHALASRYHWSERDVLALPPWRRARYMALIDREASP